jgi:Zn-dependent M28 family amino/carboxypeptidase
MEIKGKTYVTFLSRVTGLLAISLLVIWVVVARPSIVIEDKAQQNPLLESELKQHVMFLSETIAPRDSEHPDNLQKAADYISTELRPYAIDVKPQVYTVGRAAYQNVIAAFGPDTKEVIVIGAHYDAYSSLPGADDNASGIAGLLALGKLMSKAALAKRVYLVAYTLEEPPYYASEFMGSFVHAESLKEKAVELMIALEMIGYFNDEAGSQSYPSSLLRLFYPSAGNFVAVVDQLVSNEAAPLKNAINKFSRVPAYSINAPAWIPGIDFSDHRSYWHFGYPAVMVTDTAFYRNREYHRKKDTYTRLDYSKMKELVWGVHQYLLQLAAAP